MSLKPTDLVEYLEAEGELGRAEDAEVWPEYDAELGDLYLVDWRRLFGSERREPLFPDQGIDVFEGSLLDEIGSLVGQGPPSGESDISAIASRRPDVCAWYQPIHFHGLAWGIFLRDDCLRSIAVDMARWSLASTTPTPDRSRRHCSGCHSRRCTYTRCTTTRPRPTPSG